MVNYPRRRSHGTTESSADAGDDPLPPYQVRNVEMLYLEGRLDPRAAKALLPPAIRAAATRATMIAVYRAPEGWGLTPYTSCYARIAVKDYDSPDGSEGIFKFAETASAPAGRLLARHYNRICETSESVLRRSGNTLRAIGSLGGGASVEIVATSRSGPAEITAGAHTELAEAEHGLISWATAYSTSMAQCDLDTLAWTIPRGHRLSALEYGFKPTAVYRLFDKSFSLGQPGPASHIGRQATTVGAALVDILGRMKLRLVVFERDGSPAYVSPEAEAIVAGDSARTRSLTRSETFRLVSTPGAEVSIIGKPVLVRLPRGVQVVAKFLPLAAALWGRPAILCVLTDPAERPIGDPETVLRMMGLTPAEARIARLLAAGATRPFAARELGISENTVRSAMKAVHAKLEIGGRAELATLVSRLDSI